MTRRSMLIAAGACVALPRFSEGSTLAIARELRRMVGFVIVATDDVRQAWRSAETNERYIELRQSGLFKEIGDTDRLTPAFSDAIVFAKPVTSEWRRQFPGRTDRTYFEYRLLINGEFYRAEAYD